MQKPSTKYTKSDRINIAYQVFGSGPIDIVYIPGWVSNIDLMWDCPELVNFFQELGKIARIILFDKRGTGLSDRVVDVSTLEERMDDIRAVMDAVGSEKAILFGHSEGGSVSALFAATYPNRTAALIAFGIFAKRRFSQGYPWAPTDEERQKVYDMIEHSWGSGDMQLESLAPSKADDAVFMDWLANYFRSGASPTAAMVLTKMNTQVDIIDILGSIKVPTLIMQRTHDIDVKIDEGRFIAERIEGARFVEFSGNDHLFWAGDTQEILDEIKTFVSAMKPIKNHKQQLLTFVKAKIYAVDNHSQQQRIEGLVGQYIGRFRGKVIAFDKASFTAVFEGPSKAAHCSLSLVEAVAQRDARLTVGIYIKEASMENAASESENIDKTMNLILKNSDPNKVIITETVKNLLSGAGLEFASYQQKFEQISSESRLFTIRDAVSDAEAHVDSILDEIPMKGSLLENVMQCIDDHLSDEEFGVETLSKQVGMSERQLQRKLKQITNKTPNQFITSVRLHRAKELLISGSSNISEACYQTGFSSPSYFSNRFKKEFGKTPSDFLKSLV